MKFVHIRETRIETYVDTDSSLNLITQDIFRNIGVNKLEKTTKAFCGFGNFEVKPSGYFTKDIIIVLESSVYVVPNWSLKVDMIIGSELLDGVVLKIMPDIIKIEKIREQ